jgi:hypothetical protein
LTAVPTDTLHKRKVTNTDLLASGDSFHCHQELKSKASTRKDTDQSGTTRLLSSADENTLKEKSSIPAEEI